MVTRVFAEGRERTPEGYIIYPKQVDIRMRREYFCSEGMKHPAKASPPMIQDIVDFVSQPGETLMDIMSGTGTLMLATLTGRKVVLIEEAAYFHYCQTLSKEMFVQRGVDPEWITLLHGPCQYYLPIPVDHIIFSPPYSTVMQFSGKRDSSRYLSHAYQRGEDSTGSDDYLGDTPKNLSRMTPFFFQQESNKIYQQCWESIRPGGTLTVIIQDLMKGGRREELTTRAVTSCVKVGFELVEWFKRYSPGTGMKESMERKGFKVVRDEGIIVLKRP